MPRMTLQQALAHQARMAGTSALAEDSAAAASEARLHEAIREECQRRGWIALHGSMAHRSHRTIGEPDFLILTDGGRTLLVEAKSVRGKLRPEQQALQAWAWKLGHQVHVVRSLQEFLSVAECLQPNQKARHGKDVRDGLGKTGAGCQQTNCQQAMKISGKTFEPAPEYQGPAVCVDVTPLRRSNGEWGERDVFRIVFELKLEKDDGTRWHVWSKPFTPSLGKKASLYAFLKRWLARDLTAEETAEFDTDTLLGKGAEITVVHESGPKGETYANIAMCLPLKGPPLKPSGQFVREQDRKDANEDAGKGGSGSSYRRTTPAAAAAPDKADFTRTVVHVGANEGIELRDLDRDAIDKLIEKWLRVVFPKLAKPTAADKRLAAALEKYAARFAGEEEGSETEEESAEAEADY